MKKSVGIYPYLFLLSLFIIFSSEKGLHPDRHFSFTGQHKGMQKSFDPDSLYPPFNLPSSFLNPVSFSIKDTFNPDSAMHKLFPGNYYTRVYEGDTIKAINWICEKCRKYTLRDEWEHEKIIFPDAKMNQTRLLGCQKFKDENGKEYLVLSTSTSAQSDFILTGRDETGVLSIAVFIKDGAGWKLENFAPAIGGYGRWAMASQPDIIRLGKNNFGFWENNFNDGPGQPQFYQSNIIAKINGKYQEVLDLENDGMQSFTCTSWYSAISFPDSLSDKVFRDINLGYKGTLCTSDTEDYDPKILPKRIASAFMSCKDSLQFEFERKYKFEGERYKLKDEKIISIKKY